MRRHVLVAMGRAEESERALEYALREFPDARISVIHVTVARSRLDPFSGRDPCEYVIPELDVERSEELLPAPDVFTRAQRRGAEGVIARADALSARYEKEIEPVVKSGNAVGEIVRYAEAHAVDRIVIAEHPRTELRPVFRSVPESVAARADTPVTILE